MMKRHGFEWKLAMVICLTVGIIVGGFGCGKKSKEEKRITFYMWGGHQEEMQMRGWLKKFEEKHPGIGVKLINPGKRYTEKILTVCAGGIPPDILMVGAHYGAIYPYVDKGMLASLDEYIHEIKDDIDSQILKLFRWKGHYYGIPRDVNSELLFYNRALFDELKISYPDESWDWEKTVEVAKRFIKEEKGRQVRFGITAIPWKVCILSYGAKFINREGEFCLASQPKAIEALSLVTKAIEEDATPTKAEHASLGYGLDLFCSGRVAMMFSGSWCCLELAQREVPFKWDLAIVPAGKERRVTDLHFCGYAITEKCKDKDTAWKLIKFLISPEILKEIAVTGRSFPTSLKAQTFFLASPDFKDIRNKDVVFENLKYGELIPEPSLRKEILWQRIGIEIERLLLGQITVEDALQNIDKVANEILF